MQFDEPCGTPARSLVGARAKPAHAGAGFAGDERRATSSRNQLQLAVEHGAATLECSAAARGETQRVVVGRRLACRRGR